MFTRIVNPQPASFPALEKLVQHAVKEQALIVDRHEPICLEKGIDPILTKVLTYAATPAIA